MHQAANIAQDKYSERQKSVPKGMGRGFGVLQYRIKKRWEIRFWDIEDIVLKADTCIFLHDMTVRVQQDGQFKDEAAGTDIVSEINDLEGSLIERSRMKAHVNRQKEEVHLFQNLRDEAEGTLICQVKLLNNTAFFERRAGLIRCIDCNT